MTYPGRLDIFAPNFHMPNPVILHYVYGNSLNFFRTLKLKLLRKCTSLGVYGTPR